MQYIFLSLLNHFIAVVPAGNRHRRAVY